jgi:hypothetical protein
VVADPLEALERRFRQERLQRIGDVGAVDEQHRLTRPHDLIDQFDAVDLGVFHDCSSVLSGRTSLAAWSAGGHACGDIDRGFGRRRRWPSKTRRAVEGRNSRVAGS